MKKIYIILITLFISASLFSQEVLLEKEREDFSDNGDNGPNLKKYTHYFMGFGELFGTNNVGSEIKIPASFYYEMGIRHKRRITNFLAVGISLNNRYDFYKLTQDNTKTLPDAVTHDKEGLYFYKFGAEPFIRINFDKRRGNYLGYYLDFGVRADWNWLIVNRYTDKSNGVKISTDRTGFDFYEPLNYSAIAHLGFNKFEINATYRLTSIFKANQIFAELPEYAIGVNFSLVNY